MVIVTCRVRNFGLEVFQLLLPVVIQQPIESLLVIGSDEY